jgi:hypothetical protein
MQWRIGTFVAATIFVVAACSKTEPQQPVPSPASSEPPAAAAPAPAPPAPAASATSAPAATAEAPPPAAPAPAPAARSAARPPASTSRPAPAPPDATTAPRAATAAPSAPPPPPPAESKPRVAQLRAGDPIVVRTTRLLTTKTAKTGDAFSAILEQPIKSQGWIVADEGAKVAGRIVESDKGGRLKDRASISIELTSVTTADGRTVEIATSPVTQEAGKNVGKEAAKVGAGAGVGAIVGGVAGGGKGAAIGALIGGGAGAALRGEASEIPAETVITFELRSPVTIQEKK